MDTNSPNNIAKAGIWSICIAMIFLTAVYIVVALWPVFLPAGVYENIERNQKFYSETYPALLWVQQFIWIAAYLLVFAGFRSVWIRTLAICGLASMLLAATANYTQIEFLSIIVPIFSFIGLGVLCSNKHLRDKMRNVLIWYVGLTVCTEIMSRWTGFLMITQNPNPPVLLFEKMGIIMYIGIALCIACCVLWIRIWRYIYKSYGNINVEVSPAVSQLLVNRYSLTFVGIYIMANLVYYLVWQTILI